jgi:TolA-binding protein
MKMQFKRLATFLTLSMLITSCDLVQEIEKKAVVINNYERASLHLAKENRHLKIELGQLQFKTQQLKSKNSFLALQLEKKNKKNRKIASIADVSPANDLVKFNVYKWTPKQVLAVAEKEFEKKNFKKSAQFFQTFITKFPKNQNIDDQLLFQSGVASYKSGEYYGWANTNLKRLIKEYPTSKFYRGAKLWLGLTLLNDGKDDEFFSIVEEFRKKYRNTSEWKILSAHYEKILQKYKKN